MKMTFCPLCAEDMDVNEKGRQACPHCGFVNYDNPVPVTATLIPYQGGIVLVQRKFWPFVGDWCLPRGYMERNERPKASARREVSEETGLWIRVDWIIALCNPSPPNIELNQITAFYMAHVESGELKAGDDAMAVGVYNIDNLPKLCFQSDKMIIEDFFAGRIDRDYQLRYK